MSHPKICSVVVMTAVALASGGAACAQDAADRATSAQVASERDAPPPQPRARIGVDVVAPAAAIPQSDSGAVFVGAITITGLTVLSPADFADIIGKNMGQSLAPADLSRLANAISQRVRTRGFPLGLARIDAQRIANGILIVHVDEGQIDEIRIEGPNNAAVRAALAPLRNGRPVRLEEIERRLLIAGDIDGVRINGSRFFREGDRKVLVVKSGQDRIAAYANLSNQGTRPVGPEQARIEVNFNGLAASDDSLSLGYTTAISRPGELQSGYVRYEKRLNASGTELAFTASGSITHPGAYLAAFDIENRAWFIGASILQPLLRRRKQSFWVQGEIGVRNLSQWRAGVRTRRDQVTAGRVTVYGYKELLGGRMRMSTTLSQGLGVLDATEHGDPLASRRDADGTFTAINAWADWTRDLGDDFSLRITGTGQLASQPLLIGEEIGLGGIGFLRGYDWGERTGDEGAMGMVEFRYAWGEPFGGIKLAQFYAFFDGGIVSNQNEGFGGGSLASTGGGIRLDVTSRFGMNFEVAVPLTGPRYDTGNRNPKINFGVARSF